ncbi:hypothetical protein MNEG_13558 [Monoraphidium neglectum]|uniref:Uncharacterized protein n=1 Tax=Monoraphidium neglectum TaxID=145388 RepID=A0A0D2LRU4_9CHLO|nr:hypothetical protein MNEG_13558 [Monoraphidium neglectum]KIY94404.1 hypothetical protein MNEG_13558 [Monoraphidium neglectum]|eukprot:XP_013893424.1 hypothetical protein MNEG_13558 [Monoraphidium neglectum]
MLAKTGLQFTFVNQDIGSKAHMPAAQRDSCVDEWNAHIRRAVIAKAPRAVVNQMVCVAAGEFTKRQHLYVTETPSTEHTCLASGVVTMEGLAKGQRSSTGTAGRAGYCNEQDAAAAGRRLVESTSAKSQLENVAVRARQDSWKVTVTFSSPQGAKAFLAEAAYSNVRLHVQGPGGTSLQGLPELRGRAPPAPKAAEALRALSLRVDFKGSFEAAPPPAMAATIVRAALDQIIPSEKQLAEEGLTEALIARIDEFMGKPGVQELEIASFRSGVIYCVDPTSAANLSSSSAVRWTVDGANGVPIWLTISPRGADRGPELPAKLSSGGLVLGPLPSMQPEAVAAAIGALPAVLERGAAAAADDLKCTVPAVELLLYRFKLPYDAVAPSNIPAAETLQFMGDAATGACLADFVHEVLEAAARRSGGARVLIAPWGRQAGALLLLGMGQACYQLSGGGPIQLATAAGSSCGRGPSLGGKAMVSTAGADRAGPDALQQMQEQRRISLASACSYNAGVPISLMLLVQEAAHVSDAEKSKRWALVAKAVADEVEANPSRMLQLLKEAEAALSTAAAAAPPAAAAPAGAAAPAAAAAAPLRLPAPGRASAKAGKRLFLAAEALLRAKLSGAIEQPSPVAVAAVHLPSLADLGVGADSDVEWDEDDGEAEPPIGPALRPVRGPALHQELPPAARTGPAGQPPRAAPPPQQQQQQPQQQGARGRGGAGDGGRSGAHMGRGRGLHPTALERTFQAAAPGAAAAAKKAVAAAKQLAARGMQLAGQQLAGGAGAAGDPEEGEA